MPRLNLSASSLQKMVEAAAQYGIEKNVSFHKVYVSVDTGINAGSYVVSDEEWDERERLGQHHPGPQPSGYSGQPPGTSTRPGESPADYWKRQGF